MAKKKKPSKPPGIETRTAFMFPWLHERVSDAVSEKMGPVSFNKKGRNRDARDTYSTNVMGRFVCTNENCPAKKPWSSKMVAIVIRRYAAAAAGGGGPEESYNAVVFNQRCRSCNALGTFSLDQDAYVERVAYRLLKWAGVRQEEVPYRQKTGPPHEAELCEGCKRGYLSGLASNIYFSALPAMAHDVGVSVNLVNLTMTSYLVFQGLAPSLRRDLDRVPGTPGQSTQ